VKGAVFPKERWRRLTLPPEAAPQAVQVVRK
jgi:hypothetical protein